MFVPLGTIPASCDKRRLINPILKQAKAEYAKLQWSHEASGQNEKQKSERWSKDAYAGATRAGQLGLPRWTEAETKSGLPPTFMLHGL